MFVVRITEVSAQPTVNTPSSKNFLIYIPINNINYPTILALNGGEGVTKNGRTSAFSNDINTATMVHT